MRRAVIASAIGLAFVVAACGSNPTPAPPTPTPAPPAETQAPTAAPTEAPSPTVDSAIFMRKYATISARLAAAGKAFSAEIAKAKSEKAVKAAWTKYLAAFKSSIRSLKAVDWPAAAKADIQALLDDQDALVTLLNKAAAHPEQVKSLQSKITALEKKIQALASKVEAELAAP